MAKNARVLPLWADGSTKLQPVYVQVQCEFGSSRMKFLDVVQDVAAAVATCALSPKAFKVCFAG